MAIHDGHTHAHSIPNNRGWLVIALTLTLGFSVVEGVAGWVTRAIR
jgi:Co/Zn/Cd efflux system component